MSDDPGALAFACPHCGGPLHVVDDRDVACRREHRFTVGDVLLEQARTSSRATWLAVEALTDRAEASRWAARDPELHRLGDSATLEATATQDEQTAGVLRKQAQALDLTIWRMRRAPGADGTP